MVSGLKVNFNKSSFGTIGIQQVEVERFAYTLNCRSMTLPFLYLGIPIGANPRKTEMWKPIILKFSKKLAIWKSRFLSMAARRNFLWGSKNGEQKISWVSWEKICKQKN
uniref:Uncharacterized protein n=1 Tax=Cajanus cajan TaxID=3821 RepID=A0A151SI43_CAJCA|nr:hypothetical protein KK1_000641 [Cajanus cajan]